MTHIQLNTNPPVSKNWFNCRINMFINIYYVYFFRFCVFGIIIAIFNFEYSIKFTCVYMDKMQSSATCFWNIYGFVKLPRKFCFQKKSYFFNALGRFSGKKASYNYTIVWIHQYMTNYFLRYFSTKIGEIINVLFQKLYIYSFEQTTHTSSLPCT